MEIVNHGEHKIDLLNWQIDDAEGGSKPYTFGESIFLESGEYFLLTREDSDLALNNSSDEVRLIAPDKSVVDLLSYDKVREGEAYVLGDNNTWTWSSVATPGEKNKIKLVSADTEELGANATGEQEQNEDIIINQIVSLENITEIELGSMISVKGIVAVLPGVLGSQYFYITGSRGLQIYNYKKDFPDLQLGDLLFVEGELTSTNEELRLKTKSMADMVVLGHDDAPLAQKITCEDMENSQLGSLFEIAGLVVEKKGSSIFLDDGSGETLVYVKQTTGIKSTDIKKGDELSVTGILSRTTSGKRLMPRGVDDIIVLSVGDPDSEDEKMDHGQVLGEEIESSTWELGVRDNSREGLIYFFMILVTGLGLVVWLFLKYKMTRE